MSVGFFGVISTCCF